MDAMADNPRGGYNPWETGSTVYRRALLSGMAVLGLGILLAIIGAIAQVMVISWIALGIIGLGLVIHLFAQWTRFRQAQRDRDQRGGVPRN